MATRKQAADRKLIDTVVRSSVPRPDHGDLCALGAFGPGGPNADLRDGIALEPQLQDGALVDAHFPEQVLDGLGQDRRPLRPRLAVRRRQPGVRTVPAGPAGRLPGGVAPVGPEILGPVGTL